MTDTDRKPEMHNRYRSDDGTFDWITTNGNVEQAEHVKAKLREVFDPEIHINVHDLGLIYKMDIDNDNNCDVIMTLTSPFCPVAGEMPIWVKEAIEKVTSINTVKVEMTFQPTFGPEHASELAQMELGMGYETPEPSYDSWNFK